ncbi:MAG: acetyl-CoA carboxylase biotin carboxyl carrier protein [Nitrospiraceae bacterium]
MKKPGRASGAGRKDAILMPASSGPQAEPENRAKLIQELADLLRKNNLAELEFERGDTRVRLRQEFAAKPAPVAVVHDQQSATTVSPSSQASVSVTPAQDTSGLVTITSPIVGTFYRSPSPDADPYVEEGDTVKKGQVLCIVEAMKLMNEIESEVDGRIVKILVEGAKPVEYGQPLFLIEPTSAA